jgi:hypothetical protein
LYKASPKEIRDIPFARRRIWRYGEPLLSIPEHDIRTMTACLRDERRAVIRELVDIESIIQNFSTYKRTRQIQSFAVPIKRWANHYYNAVKRRIGGKSPVYAKRNSLVRPEQLFKRIYAVGHFVGALGSVVR